MPYQEIVGNLFNSKAQAYVNTVNCVGAMGKGIALEFRRRYPNMFLNYQQDCKDGKLRPGRIYAYQEPDVLILNFAIKDNWKYPSKLEWLESSLKQFISGYCQKGIQSVAFPWMGAMNGGIPLDKIQAIMRRYLSDLKDIDVEVYTYDPDAADPLFDILKRISTEPDPIKYLEISRMQRRAFQAVIEAVRSSRVNSLARLVEANIVAETSIDKLYVFLSENKKLLDRPETTKPQQPHQPRLF